MFLMAVSFVLVALLYICVCVREMSPPRSFALSRDSHSDREPRLFAPGPLYTYMDHKSRRRRRPHLTQGCSSRGWLAGVFPTCMQQPQIESLKREFIMQPANKNAQGYTPDQRSAITTWRRRLASLVGFRAYNIIFMCWD